MSTKAAQAHALRIAEAWARPRSGGNPPGVPLSYMSEAGFWQATNLEGFKGTLEQWIEFVQATHDRMKRGEKIEIVIQDDLVGPPLSKEKRERVTKFFDENINPSLIAKPKKKVEHGALEKRRSDAPQGGREREAKARRDGEGEGRGDRAAPRVEHGAPREGRSVREREAREARRGEGDPSREPAKALLVKKRKKEKRT